MLTIAVAGCAGARDTTGPNPGGQGSPELATVIVRATLPESDAELRSALGWEDGVPGALVSVLRIGTSEWLRSSTDARGQARFTGTLGGPYRVHVGRDLSPSEAATAGIAGGVFGDGATVQVPTSGDVLLDFQLSSHENGGLVISEVNGWTPPPWETGGTYTNGLYFEVFNNGVETVYLDGLIFGATLRAGETTAGHCAASATARSDSLGVYATQMIAWPGSGSEYPVSPGDVRLIAVSAIDHTPVHPNLYDLSHADFEIVGERSADNPAVPNMRDVGLDPFARLVGGTALTPLQPDQHGYFIARGFDPQAQPILYRDFNGRGYVRIGADLLIDVAAHTILWPEIDRELPPCVPMFDPIFDRYEGGYFPIALGFVAPRLSFQRRRLPAAGGRPVLSNSNTSAIDFVLADVTPGTLPPP